MFIERLRLKGFKSFGRAADLPLSPGFTAIVGPNGSGKSNLLDALRWVLGEGAPQRLRVVRQGDLLFAGSASVPAAARTEVSVTLSSHGSSRVEGSPPDCLIRRSYSQETGTVLTVDGTRVRLSDLDEVKRRWRLEGDRFAFIGQGEVAEAVHQRPAERRSHLEVLFGIDLFRKKRDETFAKLASASESALHLSALAAELEARRREIAPSVEKARAARGVMDQLEEGRRTHYFWRRRLLEETRASLEEELSGLLGREELLVFWERLWAEARAQVARRMEEGQGCLRSLAGCRNELRARREALGRGCFASAAAIKELLARRRSLAEELRQESSRVSVLESERKELRARERDLSGRAAALGEERERIVEALVEKRRAMEEEAERRESAAASAASLSGELEALRSRIMAGRSFLSASEADIEEADLAAESARKALESTNERLRLLEKRAPGLVEAHNDILARCRATGGALQSSRRESSALERRLEDLRVEEDSFYPAPVRFLSAATKLGRLPVSMSIAAEAFSCPPKIAPALEAYLGGRQFWILVETLEEAGRCIDMLKERNAGRATFLPLERSRPRSPARRFALPERGVVGWAADLVTADPRWSPAVMHLLGDLFIVEEYSDGAIMVKQGATFPIATLEGEVFSPGGSVSGGRSRAAAGAIERRNRIAAAEESLNVLRSRIEELSLALEKEEALERIRAGERDESSRAIRDAGKGAEEHQAKLDAELARRGRLLESRRAGEEELLEWERLASELEARIDALSPVPEEESEDDDLATLPKELARMESEGALLAERLSSVRALCERSDEEIGRAMERRSALVEEEGASLAREKEEREKLSRRGKEQHALFIELGEIDAEMARTSELGRSLAARAEAVSTRAVKSAERAASFKVRSEAVERRIGEVASDLSALIDANEESFTYDPSRAPRGEEGQAIASSVKRLERELASLGPIDWGALSEGDALDGRVSYLNEQIADVRAAIGELKGIIDETDRYVATVFSEALGSINIRFDSLFRRLFGGGEARLQLSAPRGAREDDEESQEAVSAEWDRGVEIVARPPGKHLQYLAQLSGGEQTLTAIAYLFAAMEAAGVPLAVLDEVDAALDESNLLRFGELAREYARPGGMQLVAMTHRRATMERADILYGVTLDEPGLSKVVGIKIDDWVEPKGGALKAEPSAGRRS